VLAPTGEQIPITSDGYTATLTQGGATLRRLDYADRALIDGFAESELPTGVRGQLLMPWTNRIGEGRYTFDGQTHQLPLSEPARNNASHGLVRWVSWTLAERSSNSVTFGYRLMAQPGYPWTLDLTARYTLGPRGLTVEQVAINRTSRVAPYVAGAHPYLVVGNRIDSLELSLPASTRLITDDRLLPIGPVPVHGSEFDYRTPRPVGPTRWDHAVTDLDRAEDGRCWVTLRDPNLGSGVGLWADETHRWLQIYSADDSPTARRSLAVEPMTGPPDAFRSGDDLIHLAPAGEPDDTFRSTWGVTALNAG
jgi:aldose 1-epimerase